MFAIVLEWAPMALGLAVAVIGFLNARLDLRPHSPAPNVHGDSPDPILQLQGHALAQTIDRGRDGQLSRRQGFFAAVSAVAGAVIVVLEVLDKVS
jgi:hypothetical protein